MPKLAGVLGSGSRARCGTGASTVGQGSAEGIAGLCLGPWGAFTAALGCDTD